MRHVGLQVVHFPGSIGQGCWGGLRAQLGHRTAVPVNTEGFVLSEQQNSVIFTGTRCICVSEAGFTLRALLKGAVLIPFVCVRDALSDSALVS